MFAATKSFFAKAPTGGALTPAWSIDWSTGTPSGYTLTRASDGTYVDSSGYIASASTDVARLTHDSSGTRLGLLVEESRTNLALRSEDFSTTWTNLASTETTNALAAPDNATTADLILETTANDVHGMFQTVSSSGSDSKCISVFVKKQNRSQMLLQLGGGGSPFKRVGQLFDIDAGVKVGSILTNGTVTDTDSGIDDYGNGWFRVWVTGASLSGNASIIICISDQTGNTAPTYNANNQPTYTGNTANGIYVWGAQSEANATRPTAYIPTTTSTVQRDPDRVYVLDSTITSWGDPGALVIHFYPPGQAGTLLSTDDASAEQLGLQASSTTAARAFWQTGDTSTGTITSGVNKAVHYWNGTASSFCINGGSVATGTNDITTFGNIDFVTLGMEATDSSGTPGTYTQYSNLIIRKVEFYSGTLSSSDLQTITT